MFSSLILTISYFIGDTETDGLNDPVRLIQIAYGFLFEKDIYESFLKPSSWSKYSLTPGKYKASF